MRHTKQLIEPIQNIGNNMKFSDRDEYLRVMWKRLLSFVSLHRRDGYITLPDYIGRLGTPKLCKEILKTAHSHHNDIMSLHN